MDTKRMITGMMLAMMVILGYQFFVAWLFKKNNWKIPGQDAPTTQIAATESAGTPTTSDSTSATQPTTEQAAASTSGVQVIATSQPAMPADIGSGVANDSTYAMLVHLNPQGASIQSVALNHYTLEVGKPDLYTFEQPDTFGPEENALATRSITINGQTTDLAFVSWNQELPPKPNAGEVTYYVDLNGQNGQLLARVRKTFHLDSIPESKGKSEGFEIAVTIAVENRTAAPMTISTTFNGPLPPRPEASRLDRTLIGGYENQGNVDLNYHSIEELKPTAPTRDMTKSDKDSLPLVWAGIGGTYFNGILRPLDIDSQKLSPEKYIQKVEADSIHPEVTAVHPRVSMNFTTTDLKIDPGATLAIPMRVFFGPKPRWLLQNDYYSAPMMGYDKTLVMSSGFCGACAVGWLINLLVDMMRIFHWVFGGFLTSDGRYGDWGLAIIALVCVVRLILHPITKKSQVNMLKMEKMGPEVERLKKKYGDDKEALSKAQMEMYKEMGFTPVLGCLPMFLQMPIFISLWQALQSTFEMRHAKFLWGLTWIKDLSQPDQLIAFHQTFDLWFLHISAINVLPMLVAVVSFLNMKYTPRPPAATPEAEQQQKMMQWMTLVFPLMFYSFPSGLNIYYLTTTSLGIVEGKRIRAHIKAHEEAEKAGKVIVDASPGRRNRGNKTESQPEPKTGLSGWITRLQEKAEQMRNEADKKNRKK